MEVLRLNGLCDCDDGTFIEMMDGEIAFDDDLNFVPDVGLGICDRRSIDGGDSEEETREGGGDKR